MASSSCQNGTNSQNMGASDPQDPILASIRTMEAVREFAADIIPLRSDGTNLHAWIGEVDKTLSDLIDRDKYLQGTPPVPLNKLEDKIARNLIYWTIPRELRSCINDTASAHDAYKALQAQFLRNNRTSHMAALVDLFNVHAEISEPQDITMLYDRMYKGMNELLASGFQVNPDTLLGALFQIAVGRGNSQLYMATSQLLDTIVPDEKQVSSRDVAAAARRQFEHLRSTVFDEDPIPHTAGEAMESLHVPVDEASEHPNSTSGRNSFTNLHGNPPASRQAGGDQSNSGNVPSKRPNPPDGSKAQQQAGPPNTRAAQPAPAGQPPSSAPQQAAEPPPTQVAPPSNPAPQASMPANGTAQPQASKSSTFSFTNTSSAATARPVSPVPTNRPSSGKPPAATSLFGATPLASSPLANNVTPLPATSSTLFGKPLAATTASTSLASNPSAESATNSTHIFGKPSTAASPAAAAAAAATATANLFSKSSAKTGSPPPSLFSFSQKPNEAESKKSLFSSSFSSTTPATATAPTAASQSPKKDSKKSSK